MSTEEIQTAYARLATEAGDLFFALEGHRKQVNAIEARLVQLQSQRDSLQKALEKAQDAVKVETSSVPTPEP